MRSTNAFAGLRLGPSGRCAASAMCVLLGTATMARAQDGFNPGANGVVNAVVVQADGKILVGGHFSTLGGGGTGTETHNNIGRLNADGSIDSGFAGGTAGGVGSLGTVFAIAVQPDGKILIGGDFLTVNGTSMRYLSRLKADGTLDDSWFDPFPSGPVYALALQSDGKILVGGHFNNFFFGGGIRVNLGRLYAGGTLDLSFDPGATGGAGLDSVFALTVQPDGKILVGGDFTGLGGGTGDTPRSHLGRVNIDGSVDMAFDPGSSWVDPLFGDELGQVSAFALQPDGKIVVGGYFKMLGGGGSGTTARRNIGRLNADGSLDTQFDPGAGPDDYSSVVALSLQADGKILVGGNFTTLGGGGLGTTSRNFIGRLNSTGSLDTGFNPGVKGINLNSAVGVLALQDGGTILIGGHFNGIGEGTGSTVRNYLGRVSGDGSVDAISLSATIFASGTAGTAYGPTTITQTGGVGTTTFAVTGGGLPSGMALSTGGTVSGTPVVTGSFNVTVGAADTGAHSGSRTYAIAIACPAIALSATAFPGGTAGAAYSVTTITQTGGIGTTTFSVTSGALPVGMTLSSAGAVSGTPAEGGAFTFAVTATDANGCTGARSYDITVASGAPTIITTQPVSQIIQSGHTAQLSVAASGPAPLAYQWYVGTSGVTSGPISGATSSGYATPPLTSTTNYWVRVSGASGAPADSITASIQVTTYQPFTDDQLTEDVSLIRLVHITELRARIDAVRAHYGLAAFGYTEPVLTAGVTTIKAQQIIELRSALAEAYVAAHRTPPTYTDPNLTAGVRMQTVHIMEIRAALIGIE